MTDQPESRRPRVYVVDDEGTIATTLALILNNAGYAAKAFLDPIEAMASAALDTPDIVITDVMMPRMNGVDLSIHFRETYPACRILIFAGHGSTGDLLKVARSRGYDFELLSKPMHPKDLLRTLNGDAAEA
jgi:FixJ family two-component response regulator